MKKTYIITLYFKNAVHVGASEPGIGIEGTEKQIIHSDTLWAALCNNWAIMRKAGEISFDEFLNSFETGNPLFRISSAFPITKTRTGTDEYWLPKPLSVPFAFSNSNPKLSHSYKKKYAKDIKSLQFIRLSDFINWIRFEDKIAVDRLADKDNQPEKITDMLRPHNTLDRVSFASQIFHSGTTYFDPRKQSGFYFLLQTDERKSEKVESAMKHLHEIIRETAGIGGNRSIGLGAIHQFDILPFEKTGKQKSDWYALDVGGDTLSETNAHCLLSLWHPNSPSDYHKTAVAYNLLLRKGWTGSLSVPWQVKRITAHMFSEGSVFTTKPDGHLLDLSPDETPSGRPYPHPIYRYGYAFTVPMKIYTGD